MKNTKTRRIDFMALLRTVARLALFVAVVYIVHQLISWIMAEADGAKNTSLMIGVMVLVLLTYILLISIPFVPGIEIAMSLMVLHGTSVVVWVYVATIIGLFLAFLAGQYLSYSYLHGVFSDLRMKRACALLEKVQPLSRTDRLDLLKQKIPHRLRPLLVDGRYALIGVVLNIPGNAVIGGGGGILFIAGLSRLFTTGWIIVTLIIAVAPVPIAILGFGIDPMAFLRTP
jgi:hypothetical protein